MYSYIFLIFILSLKKSQGIIGGKIANKSAWSTITLINFRTENFCGGSLFRSDWIITAAQCLMPSYMESDHIKDIIIGGYNLSNTNEGKVRYRKYSKMHPSFRKKDYLTFHDIGIIHLNSSVKIKPTPLALPSQRPAVGTVCKTAGWGMDAPNIFFKNVTLLDELYRPEKILYEINQTIVDINDCNELIQPGDLKLDDHICVVASGAPGNGPASGDFGGPLVCDGVTAGVSCFSLRNRSVKLMTHTVYTPTDSYRTWIHGVIKRRTNNNLKEKARSGSKLVFINKLIVVCFIVNKCLRK